MTVDIVVDANVVVSAQLVQHPAAPPFRTFTAVFQRGFQNHTTGPLLAEIQDVLLRREVLRRHALTIEEVRDVVGTFRAASLVVTPPRAIVRAPDPGDQHLWDLLAGYPELTLVTGDPLLLESHDFPGRILSPRQFVEQLLGSGTRE